MNLQHQRWQNSKQMLLEIYELFKPIAKVLNDLSEARVTTGKPQRARKKLDY